MVKSTVAFFLCRLGLLSLGDEFNLYECTLGQVLNGKCAAGREGSREELGVNLVHGSEVGDVTKEYSRLDHIFFCGRFNISCISGNHI